MLPNSLWSSPFNSYIDLVIALKIACAGVLAWMVLVGTDILDELSRLSRNAYFLLATKHVKNLENPSKKRMTRSNLTKSNVG